MEHTITLRGTGRAEVAAYGVADAEHLVEKELAAAWPGARVEILELARQGEPGRIVEEFTVRYRVSGTVAVEAESPEAARREALRQLRERLAPTRHRRIEWEAPK
jgi:hypothetical protein